MLMNDLSNFSCTAVNVYTCILLIKNKIRIRSGMCHVESVSAQSGSNGGFTIVQMSVLRRDDKLVHT